MEKIIIAILGVFLIFAGILTLKGNSFFIKRRYLRNVTDEDYSAFCKLNGISFIAEGISFAATSIIIHFLGEQTIWIIPTIVLFVASSIPAIIATIKYSGKR